jgi:hypothetical protein
VPVVPHEHPTCDSLRQQRLDLVHLSTRQPSKSS